MKKVIFILSIVTLFAIIGAGWYIATSLVDMWEPAASEAQEEQDEVVEETELDEVEVEWVEEEVYLNPFGDPMELAELTDGAYQNYIHKMSHQKVVANVKWGFYEITNERINWLLEGLSVAELEHKQTYQDILVRWASGDFSQVDKDHNTVWQLQGGTIGEATGILSPEEEQAYIKTQKE